MKLFLAFSIFGLVACVASAPAPGDETDTASALSTPQDVTCHTTFDCELCTQHNGVINEHMVKESVCSDGTTTILQTSVCGSGCE